MTKKATKTGLTLTDAEATACAKHIAEGFTPSGRRRYPVLMDLTDAQIVELGEQAARIDADLKVMRQGKNATSAALNREKREREGVMHMLAGRVLSGKDEMGKQLTLAERAAYTRKQAAERQAFDQWEEQRKATLDGLKTELAEKETAHAALSNQIAGGKGNRMVSVIDLTDYTTGTVVSVRADNGDEVGRRALADHERQMPMFEELAAAESLTEQEYAWCVSGRTNEAVHAYAERLKLDPMKARRLVVGMLNRDEELPEEAGDEGDDDDGE